MEWLRTPLVDERAAAAAADAQAAQAQQPKKDGRQRLLQIDLLRGCIMAVMAWDHSRDMISDNRLPVNRGFEMWDGPLANYDNHAGLFLQRWLPHFCAPGFFFLMGMGMAFFHSSRLAKFASGEWSNARLVKHFAIRGVLLILMDRVVNIPSYLRLVNPENYSNGYVPPGSRALLGLLSIFEVLTALGLSMLFCGALLPVLAALSARVRYLRRGVLVITGGQILALILGLAMFAASDAAIIHYQGGASADPSVASAAFPGSSVPAQSFVQYLLRFTLVPGAYPQGFIAYPLLPWCGICLWGIAAGYFLASPLGRAQVNALFLCIGAGCTLCFILIRTFGGAVGNLRGWGRSSSDPSRQEHFLLAFLDVCKYPPSLAFAMLTLAGDAWLCFALGSLLQRLQRGAERRLAEEEEARRRSGMIRARVVAPPRGGGGAAAAGSVAQLAERTWTPPPLSTSGGGGGGEHRQWNLDGVANLQSLSPLALHAGGRGSLNGHGFPAPVAVHSSSSSPAAPTITVSMVQPGLGTPYGDSDCDSEDGAGSGRCAATAGWCCARSVFVEFPLWSWWGRWLLFPLLTFGRVPLFFYVVHWYLLGLGALVLHALGPGLWMPYVLIWWAAMLVGLFFLCAPYTRFKERQGPESLWRFL